MSKRKIFLALQSVLCILIAVLLAASAIRIFLEGSAWQAAGHPSDWIYTREKVAERLVPILPLVLASIAMTVTGIVKGIKDEDADKPVKASKAARTPAPLVSVSPETGRRRVLIRRILMAVAVLFIILGIFNGSMKDVLVKAIRICTECIGLG